MDSGTLKPPRCRRQSRTTARLQGTQRKLMSLFQQMRPLKYRTTLESLRSKLSNRTSSTARSRWSMWEETFLERPSKQESQDRPPFESMMSTGSESLMTRCRVGLLASAGSWCSSMRESKSSDWEMRESATRRELKRSDTQISEKNEEAAIRRRKELKK